MSKFQIILLSVFGAFILIAVILFSVSKGTNTGTQNIVVWGDIPAYDFNALLANLPQNDQFRIQYFEKSKETFDTEFTEALAIGQGPDVVILPLSKIEKNKNKLLLIPSSSVSPQDFTETFIEEAQLLMYPEGIYALPLSVDPLVLYWNRDLLSSAAVTAPPAYWDEIYGYADKLIARDNAGNIQKALIPLGEAKNIPNAKDILSLLMLQAGTPITSYQGTELHSLLSEDFDLPLVPAQAALDFYTQFSNPAKPFYTWNRSMLDAETAFASGDVAMYVGYASELPLLRAKNPTLNLGITSVPQSRVSGKKITFGSLEGVAVVKNTSKQQAAFEAMLFLASKDTSLALSNITLLPPARIDLLANKPADLAQSVFYDAAIQARGWLDPDPVKTEDIFVNMIESITSGRARIAEAVSSADQEIDSIAQTK
jgi:ABC-type glycerol-3-phosphate transport system substrate-binding protein